MEEVLHFSNSFNLLFSFHESKTTRTFSIMLSQSVSSPMWENTVYLPKYPNIFCGSFN